MASFFLNLGLSYTWSKALPYFILIALGIILGVMLFKRSKSLGMKIASLVAIVIPFIVYFAINPIYQGDFSNDSRIIYPSEQLMCHMYLKGFLFAFFLKKKKRKKTCYFQEHE